MPFLSVPRAVGVLLAARFAIYLAFFNLGAGIGLWAVFIPIVRDRLGISEGVLGIALLALSAGAMAAMPATGWAIARFGSHAISAAAAVLMPLAAALPILAPSLPLFFLGALMLGAAAGTLDVSMNNEAARLEMALGKPSMSGFHGLYSIGGLAGAAAGALLVGLGSAAGWSAAATLATLALAAVLIRGWYLPPATRPITRLRFALPSRALLLLGVLAFLCFGVEGAIADWSALFLVTDKAASPAVAAAGYAAFAASMAVMRFVGDRLVARTGRRRAVILGGLTLAVGGSLAMLAGDAVLGAAGFGLVGVGAANIVPVLLSTAARYPRGSGGVAAVSTIGYLGTLTWPPVIGGIAEAAGLPAALWLIAAAGVAIGACAGLVSRPWTIPPQDDSSAA
jgi:MFS family permease